VTQTPTAATPALIGARCEACAAVVFPAQAGCPRCAGPMTEHPLPSTGRVWTWTMQYTEPKPPYRRPAGGFEPFAVGYVDLGEVLVESRLLVAETELEIGAPVRLADHVPNALAFAFELER
jgi:uncharacterized OB-fold protein